MGSNALVIEAKLALANWSKYESLEPDYMEEIYQANKVASALRHLIDNLEEDKDKDVDDHFADFASETNTHR